MLSILILAGLAVCVVASLATAIMYAMGKKAVIPLALYGIAVLLVLGAEAVLLNSEPVPRKATASHSADVTASLPQQPATPPSAAPLAQQQDDTELEEDGNQEEVLPPEEESAAAEPLAKSEPASTPASSAPPKTSSEKSEPATEVVAAPVHDDATFTIPPEPEPLVNAEPMLAESIPPASDSGPVLAGDPVLSLMSNPTLTGSSGAENSNNFNTYNNPDQHNTTDKWVLNTSTLKIHYPSCNDVEKIAPQNYATSNLSESELISQGYTTCGHCH